LEILGISGKEYSVREYLNDVPTKDELKNILAILNINPIELIRKNESIWKENYKNVTLTDDEIIDAMIKYPKLIERPIVINGEKAVIGRPPSKILDII
jgi:arsenate reductase